MEQGWISIHRKLREHWLWQETPFDKRSAWIDILMSANHCDNKVLLGKTLIDVSRGQLITSEVKLMKKWGWSKTKVRSFLDMLEKENMIIKTTETKKTTGRGHCGINQGNGMKVPAGDPIKYAAIH